MRFGEGNPRYSEEIINELNALRDDEDFIYLTKHGIGNKMKINSKTFYEWLKTKPDFAAAVDAILKDIESEYQKVVTKRAMSGEKMSAAWMIYRTANVFGWRNTVEVTNSKQHHLDELNDEVNKKLATTIPLDGK